MSSEAKIRRLVFQAQDPARFGDSIAQFFPMSEWAVLFEVPGALEGALTAEAGLSGRRSAHAIRADVVVIEVPGSAKRLNTRDDLRIAFEEASHRSERPPAGSSLAVLVLDRRGLVADAADPGYGIALAEVKATARVQALAGAPGLRLGVIVADLGSAAAPDEVAAALALLAGSRAMTGVVIELD